MSTYGGWAGKVLRVNLTTGQISQEDTVAKYKDYIGGAGIGLKVMWDEVPGNVKAFDPENKVVFGGGPLTGTNAPSAARMSIISRSPMFYEKEYPDLSLVSINHMGGDWSSVLKFAGWDAVVIEGRAAKPSYIAIDNGKVEIRDASRMWGQGNWKAQMDMIGEVGSDSAALTIGQAGENLVPCSMVMSSFKNKAGGGHAAVMGSKNLKGICVRGDGSIKISADKTEWKALIDYMIPMLSIHNNAQPLKQQSWSEYARGFYFWSGGPGSYWGAANPRRYLGVTDPHDINSMGYRTNQYVYSYKDHWRYLVRNDSCFGCPLACWLMTKADMLKWGYPALKSNTCAQGTMGSSFIKKLGATDAERHQQYLVGAHAMDDFGIWDGYLVMGATFKYIVDKGIVREKLSEAEYNSINWPGYENGDPEFIFDIVRRIAFKDGELGTALGLGPIRLAERWGIYDQLTNAEEAKIWTRGNGQRHYNGGQIGSLVHIIFNNEACTQEFSQMTVSSGLPWEAQKEIGKQLFGGDFIDFNGMMSGGGDLMTPMNEYKAKFAAFAVNEKMLKDSLTLCNRAFAVKISPLKERNYVGDLTLESQMYSLVTGDVKDFDELQLAGNRMATLLRAITLRDYNTKNIRNEHDYVPEYMFADQHNIEPFTKGSIYLDREDWEVAKDMFYGKMGWDKTTGAPTRAHLEKVGLKYVADELAAKALLP